MSLRHILNDDPPPPVRLFRPVVPSGSPELVFGNGSASPLPAPSYVSTSRRSPSDHETGPGSSNPRAFYTSSYDGERGFVDSRNGYHEEDQLMEEVAPEPHGRKRRKADDDDEDYLPPVQRQRNGSRRSIRSKQSQARAKSPVPPFEVYRPDLTYRQPTEEERRLASSDLEDCEEIWSEELSDYVLETQKRQKQVEAWFDYSCLERNSGVAHSLSHHYAHRLTNIPQHPPHPPQNLPPPPVEEERLPSLRIHSPSAFTQDTQEAQGDWPQPYDRSEGADVAAQMLEDSILGEPSTPASPRPVPERSPSKRPPPPSGSDSGSDLEIPLRTQRGRGGPASKKRRVDNAVDEVADSLERAVIDEPVPPAPAPEVPKSISAKGKGKGKGKQREQSVDSTSTAGKVPRRRTGPRKKLDALPPHTQEYLGVPSASASVSRDGTPSVSNSRPVSPAPTNTSVVFELDEPIPALKKAKKVDEQTMRKRIKSLEEAQRKVWTNIAKRDIPKVYKYYTTGYQVRQGQAKRLAMSCSMQARKPYVRTAKANKDLQAKSKRLMREMLVFWKKNEKEERDVRRREQKEALDRARIEEERREAARQARKLEFLISQTELYSHFVGSKLKTAEIEGEGSAAAIPAGADYVDGEQDMLQDIDFDDEDQTNLRRHAARNAQEAIELARQRAQDFDKEAALQRKTSEALQLAKGGDKQSRQTSEQETPASTTPLVDLDSDELNFQNPTSLSGPLTVQQPVMLDAQLKEYQLKGLNWLATLYEKGINGILADEMGLGKTVQSISLLAYLAETHDIWGPFLVVAPASTLHNWQQEITRFVPKLKALPYWGNVKDRATLRKFWSKKEISYNEDAPFHVLITSYQLVTQDQQYFQRVRWQYMILDEAQNIKNSSSVRWKTLLGFNCRNRLLLTGTPIQNNMQELWALLHFIMPSLFDSHDEFSEWFSKDIENAAENKGSKLNEHQLRRLHMILKPFMLRRVKRHVQNELSEKIEIDIHVDLSFRQRALYKALLANVSVADLLAKAANIGDAESARTLMNLVMQFRKVCNHPELFERADVVAPFSFAHFGHSGPLNREGDLLIVPKSIRNPIEYVIPELFYREGVLAGVPPEHAPAQSSRLARLMNIWNTDWIQRSLYEDLHSSFAFLRLLGISPGEAHEVQIKPLMTRRLSAAQDEARLLSNDSYSDTSDALRAVSSPFRVASSVSSCSLQLAQELPPLDQIARAKWSESCLSRPGLKFFVPSVVAPPVSIYCTDRTFLDRQSQHLEAPIESLALFGLPPPLLDSEDACACYQDNFGGLSPVGLIGTSPVDQLPASTMQVPEAKRLIYDSAKLARLDSLLQELKAGNHRVLIYFQMTRMMDLMEEYLIYRQHKYLRLDGSSKLEDRRDMVIDWQTKPDIFVFLLSTRAGGLGINLTAADTVIFYDHDWNPSNDAQAMDRAHRLGQTRQVTVYRLITKGTIDERIVQLARVKKDVQDIVVGNKTFTDVTKPSEIVQLLLPEDQLADLNSSSGSSSQVGQQGQAVADVNGQDLWNDEGDEFFGHSAGGAAGAAHDSVVEDVEPSSTATATRGKKRKTGVSATRGSKAGSRGGKRKSGARADASPGPD